MNYQKIYDNLISKSKLRGLDKSSIDAYTEYHHIIPSCIGGINTDDNKVLLTAAEHYLAHQLLIKIYKNHPNKRFYHSLVLAARNMTINAKYTIRNNKMYSWVRTEYSKSQSEARTGKGNPFYGKHHSNENKEMWSLKRSGEGNSMYGKKRPEISALMSSIKRGPQWKYYDELKKLWIDSGMPGYVKFRRISVANGYPDIVYQKIIDHFRRA
ncbi:homing endonuclease [Klebsiella phage vB_KpnM_5N]|jgi:hypothetical protein|nr:homing endonuclease [Klebsiella phage vB_KpnM_5N]